MTDKETFARTVSQDELEEEDSMQVVDDDDDNINKCCLKALDFNKQTSIGLVSGPKQNGNLLRC